MKAHLNLIVVVIFTMALCAPLNSLGAKKNKSSFGIGARRHAKNTTLDDLPFEDGDWSYGAIYQKGNDRAAWQLGALYAPEPGTNSMDYAITPQANLVVKQGFWQGGVGLLKTYTVTADGKSDWSSLYWQGMAGFELPLGGFTLTAYAYYTFDKWGNITDFETDALEFGGWLTYAF